MSSLCKKVISFCLACFLFVTICGGLNQTEASQIPLDDNVVAAARKLCKQYKIDPALLWAVIECESNFNVNSGNSYCKGLMAVHKSYAAAYAKKAGMSSYDLFDPIDNIHIGLEMLKEHINKYGDTEDALIAYNNGDGGAQSYFKDGVHSTSYSRKVMKARAKWQAVEAAEAADAAAAEKAAKEAAEKAAAEKAAKEAAEKAAAEKAAKEAAEKAAAEKAAREAAEKAAREKAEREAAERAADEAKINAISTISVNSASKSLKALDLRVVRLSDLFV